MDPNTTTVIHARETQEFSNAEDAVEPSNHQHPTGSMVTINLSDPEPTILEEASIREGIADAETLEEFPKMGEEQNLANQPNDPAMYEHQRPMLAEEAEVVQRIHRDSLTAAYRESTVSMLSAVEEGRADAASSIIRSRSDSSGTYSSVGSVQFDWDELDKSEEQAPRDEGSDEVIASEGIYHVYKMLTTPISPPHSSLLGSNKRIMLSLLIPRQL